jgi:hypothetical protein
MVWCEAGSYGRVYHPFPRGQPAVEAGWLQVTVPDPFTGRPVAVAVNVIGLPASVPEDAVAVLAPAAGPRVSVLKARPALSVVAVAGVTLPPPAVTVNVMLTPEIGFPPASVTLTTNGLASLCPIVPVCVFPLTETRVVATGDAPLLVAVKVNGLPVREPEDTVTVLTPAVAPRVSVVDANPEASLVAEAADKDPEPLVTAKFTTVPDTPKPFWSVT